MKRTSEIKNFIHSHYFADGLRITFGVLLPPLLISQFWNLEPGIIVSIGAFTASVPDSLGPTTHKRNGMLATIAFVVLTAMLTGLINQNPYLLVIEIFSLCFLYSMFNVYGNRASSIGTASLIIMVLTIDRAFKFNELLNYCSLLFAGGLWYFLLSYGLMLIKPYRMAQQALGESIAKVADYIAIKASFYDLNTDIDEDYKHLVDKQIEVHQQQDAVREILFKDKMITKNPSYTARVLVLVFSDIVDLFEQSTAIHYDYKTIRTRFEDSSVLREFKTIITNISNEIEHLAHQVTANEVPTPNQNFQAQLEQLKYHIDMVDNNLILKRIMVNVRNMVLRIQTIYSYFSEKNQEKILKKSDKEFTRFISHQLIDYKAFNDNLTLESNNYRHSLRVAITCLIGYLISHFLSGTHSYWVLLTIVVILKPAFSLTRERNYQRLVGTLVGGIAGGLILYFVDEPQHRFLFMLVFMIGAYSFQRLNYIICVLFMTPFVLIMLSFLGVGDLAVVKERIIDTIIGSVIALLGSYFVFPNWEYYKLRSHMQKLLKANFSYLTEMVKAFTGQIFSEVDYKVSRKEVYVESANLASVLQRMLTEPKDKQKDVNELRNFILLNHNLSSYIATLASYSKNNPQRIINSDYVKILIKSLNQVNMALSNLNQLDEKLEVNEILNYEPINTVADVEINAESNLISDQINFIDNATFEILKITEAMKKNQMPD